jgi:hypothetical protein
MNYLLIPVIVCIFVAVFCLDIRAGLWVMDRTEGTSFSSGYYMITVFTLLAAELSILSYVLSNT